MKIHQDNAGNIVMMAAMPIYGKNTLKIFLSGTNGLIMMRRCIKHQRHKPFIPCSNYDPWLTLSFLW